MRFVCVVNPVSGRGKALPLAEKLASLLEQRGASVRQLLTTRDIEAFGQLCAGIAADERVICIGGDGTLLYFLNAARQFKDVAFYGMGTANVVMIEYGLPREPNAFADMVMAGKTTQIRPGVLDNGTRFLMMASMGFDAFILSRVSQRLKNRFGKWAFIPPGLSLLWKYKYPQVDVILDNKQSKRFSFLSICRFKHYGGKFVLAPEAQADADSFQVLGVEGKGLASVLRFLFGLITGDPLGRGGMFCATARTVAFSGKVPCQADGDYLSAGFTSAELDTETFALVVP